MKKYIIAAALAIMLLSVAAFVAIGDQGSEPGEELPCPGWVTVPDSNCPGRCYGQAVTYHKERYDCPGQENNGAVRWYAQTNDVPPRSCTSASSPCMIGYE